MATTKEYSSIFTHMIEGLEEAAVSACGQLAEDVVKVMKNTLAEHKPYPAIYKGDLIDSITYGVKGAKTAKYFPSDESRPGNPNMKLVGGRAKSEHVIQPVTQRLTAVIGTANKTGKYINYGTRAHKKWEGHSEFVARIEEWCLDHGFDLKFADYLIHRIKYGGTASVPFLTEGESFIEEHGKAYVDQAMRKLMSRLPVVQRVISAKGIAITVSRKRTMK